MAFRKIVTKNQEIENHRHAKSIMQVSELKFIPQSREQELLRIQPILEKREMQRKIAEREHERAIKMANLYREKLEKGIITHLELPSFPVGKRDKDQKLGYDATCFHREYAVVKCQNETETAKKTDAWNAAVDAEKDHLTLLRNQMLRSETIRNSMLERQKQAKKGLLMEQVIISRNFIL